MPDDALAFASAYEVRRLLDSRQVSSMELTELFLRRIENLDPKLNAYLTVTADLAMDQARIADEATARGESLGALHGIPISIKDLESTKGVRTTFGSLPFKDYVPDRDSVVVERIKAAGAVILGKTNTPEHGFRGTTENRLGEPCRNPWSPERTSGGSSGGAAVAVVSGLCTLATGSDGGGSIRMPASFCGVYGIKPSQGRVPRFGGVGRPAFNFLSQSGPMTRTVDDSAALLQVLAGRDERDTGCMTETPPDWLEELHDGVKGLKVGWSPDLGFAAVDSEVADATRKAAKVFQQELGCSVEDAGIRLEDPFLVFWDLFRVQGYSAYGGIYEERPEDFSSYGRLSMEYGQAITVPEYSRALVERQKLKRFMEDKLDEFDLLLTPTMAVTAFPIEQFPSVIGGRKVNPAWSYTPFTSLINMSGQTAASIPCGFSSEGLPIGLHIIGRKGDEATVLRASAAFEEARLWLDKRPPVS